MKLLAVFYTQMGERKEAINLYKQLYKVGYNEACFNLGMLMEMDGELDEAERYYKKSADNGDMKSQYRLAYIKYRQED